MYRAIVQVEAAYAASAAVIHWQKPTKEVLGLSLKEEFDRDFQPVLESISLPERLAGRYTPESCVACREDGEVWLLRDGADSRFILKVDRTGARDLAGEFALTRRLPQNLRVPRPVDCFQEGVSLEPAAALRHLEFISLLSCRGMDYTPLLRIPTLGGFSGVQKLLFPLHSMRPLRSMMTVSMGKK